MKVCVHQLGNNVNVVEGVVTLRLVDIENGQDVVMVHARQKANLANDSFRVCQVVEHASNLLHGDAPRELRIVGGAHDAICAQTKSLVESIARVKAKRSALCEKVVLRREGLDGGGGSIDVHGVGCG